MKKLLGPALTAGCLVFSLSYCDGSAANKAAAEAVNDTTTDDTTTDDGSGSTPKGFEDLLNVNALASVIPSSLAISFFPQESSGASLADEVLDPNLSKDTQEKIAETEKRLKGEGDCFDPDVFRPKRDAFGEITCYEFDSEMNPHETNQNNNSFGTTDGTDGNGEACMVAFTRAEVNDTVERIDQAVAMVSGLLCEAKKAGKATELAPGEDVDLASVVSTLGSHGGPTVSSAVVTRNEDTADGEEVYYTKVVFTPPSGAEHEVNLYNIANKDTGEMRGTLWVKRDNTQAQLTDPLPPANPPPNNPPPPGDGPMVDPNNTENKVDVMSINYHKFLDDDEQPRMRAETRFAQILNTIDPFDDTGLVNYVGVSENAANETIHAIKFVSFDMNPDTSEGRLAYWMNPGGSYNESARGFLFNIENDAEGVLKGCGVSGNAKNVSIRKSLVDPSDDNALKPTGYWHPQHNDNISPDKDPRYDAQEGNKITKQCFKKDDEGAYVIDKDVMAADDTESRTRGYEVIEVAASNVEPPRPPEKKIEDNILPPPQN